MKNQIVLPRKTTLHVCLDQLFFINDQLCQGMDNESGTGPELG